MVTRKEGEMGFVRSDSIGKFIPPIANLEVVPIEQGRLHERINLQLGTIKHVDNFEAPKLSALYKNLNSTINLRNSIVEQLLAAEKNKTIQIQEAVFSHLSILGLTLRLSQTIQDILRVRSRSTIGDDQLESAKEVAKLQEFALTRALQIKVNGVKITDFDTSGKSVKENASFLWPTLVENESALHNRSYEDLIKQNQNELMTEYPNLAMDAVTSALTWIRNLNSADPQLIDSLIQKLGDYPKLESSLSLVKKIVDGVWIVKQHIMEVIQNPNATDFTQVKEVIRKYLLQDKVARANALQSLTPFPSRMKKMYRTIKELKEHGVEQEFYQLLEDSLLEYVDETPIDLGIYRKDDAAAVFDEEEKPPSQEHSLQDIRKIISGIATKAHDTEYLIAEEFDWGAFVPPKEASILFTKNKPQELTFKLSYENDFGESCEIKFVLNTQKQTFDWSFIEDPKSEEMKLVYQYAMDVAFRALSQVLTDVERKAKEKQQLKQKSIGTLKPSEKQKKVRPLKPKEEVEEIKRDRIPLSPIKQALMEETRPSKEEQAKNQIIVPDPESEEFKNLIDRLSEEDKKRMPGELEDYNNNPQPGNFSKLKGVLLYRLGISSKVPKGIRVLLRRKERNLFEIVDIDYRKEIYRRHKL